jgi:hypothetical protein
MYSTINSLNGEWGLSYNSQTDYPSENFLSITDMTDPSITFDIVDEGWTSGIVVHNWSNDHTYKLVMSVYAASGQDYAWGEFLSNPMDVWLKTNMVFKSVPEPAILLLLGMGSISLIGSRRRVEF